MPGEYETKQDESMPDNGGGAAPEHRRCKYTRADGKSCRDWAIRGQDFCHRHGIFLRRESVQRIDVPLLEDESAIVLVLSETLRALAWGTMPVNNGRLILDGCRLAHSMQMEKQKTAGHRVCRSRKCMCEEKEMREDSPEPEAASQEQEAGSEKEESGSDKQEAACRAANPAPGAQGPELAVRYRFSPPCGETRHEDLAAQEAPLEELMEEEALAAV